MYCVLNLSASVDMKYLLKRTSMSSKNILRKK